MDLYREEILEHWQNPQNFGEMKKPDLVIDQINPLCGDEVTFYFKFSKVQKYKSTIGKRKIESVSFIGKGCAISIAAASIMSEKIKGKSVHELVKITGEDVFEMLGGPIAPARLKCAFLPLEVIRKLRVEKVRFVLQK